MGSQKRGCILMVMKMEDVVNYHDKFIQWWKEYEKRMVTFDNDGNIVTTGFPVAGGKF